MKNSLRKIYGVSSLFIFFVFWEIFVVLNQYPKFILPKPSIIFVRGLDIILDGTLFYHFQVTLTEILLGLFLGFNSAFLLGFLLAKSNLLKDYLTPIIVSFQAVPILALAPLLIIWFGSGKLSKVLVCALTLFFPVLINTIVGFNNVEKRLDSLLESLEANIWQKLIYLEIPSALPIIISSLKIAVTLSVIGAVVGEFIGSNKGLGFLINLSGGLYDTPLRFVAFFSLSFIALSLYSLVNILEKKIIKWRI